jgi:hypothetical protein
MITRFSDRTEVILANDDSATLTTIVGLWPFQSKDTTVLAPGEVLDRISYESSVRPVVVRSDTSVDTFLPQPPTKKPVFCSCV